MIYYNAIYPSGHFEQILLGDMIHRGGASGKIFLVENKENSVAKIFHDTKKSATNRQKLESMLLNRPVFPPAVQDGVEYVQLAWPDALLEDENGFCVGYLMPLIHMEQAVSLDHLMQKAIRKKLELPDKYAYRVFAAYNTASMVSALHSKGHYVVDLKPSNVSVYKANMMVAMVDCDGFSIKGEKNRYPAEFVSEEYIYPEGMDLSCEEMGEEQDKFALAVMIFKLLNNGIHPFSGVPRKPSEEMLTIQQRIEKYHYAYGLWPDAYQAPHPYSIHEYFHKKTLELFERAFVKGAVRPSANEWKEHLWQLLQNLKICKKNSNHVYFTSKGCGLCVADQKFDERLSNVKIKKETPQTVRGMELSEISVEKNIQNRQEKTLKDIRLRNASLSGLAVYMLFFTFLFKMIQPFKESIASMGFGLQMIGVTLLMAGINLLIKKFATKLPILQNKALMQAVQVYALICMIIALVSINELPKGMFALAL